MALEDYISISDLPSKTTLQDSDNFLVEDTSNTKKTTAKDLADYVEGKYPYVTAGKKSGTTLGNKATAEGTNTTALGASSHAEGSETKTDGEGAHSEGYKTVARGIGAHAEGYAREMYTANSFNAETEDSGNWVVAIGNGAHAEGRPEVDERSLAASGEGAHAEGVGSQAIGSSGPHAEGYCTRVSNGVSGHAEGYRTLVTNCHAGHAEGYETIVSESYSHAEGCKTSACGHSSHAEGGAIESFNPETDSIENDEGYWVIASGEDSHAEGTNAYITEWYSLIASGKASHAEGGGTKATANYAHAEGQGSLASGAASHAEGDRTQASGKSSHAGGFHSFSEGSYSFAHGDNAIAVDSNTTALGSHTNADGRNSIAVNYRSRTEANNASAFGDDTYAYGTNQFCIGMCNRQNGRGKNWAYRTGDKLFQIGNGTSAVYNGDELITPEARSNVFSVSDSAVYGTGSYNSSGADYAEMFEWADGNPNDEDRAGKFVTLDGSKLVLAKSSDDYILGVVSGRPSVCGDVADDQWNQMYLTDVYGRFLYEDIDYPEEKDEEGNVITEAQSATRLALNPDYDPTKEYIPRSERPEWSPVGLLGKLVCIDDGTAEVNHYVKVNDDSIATASSERTKYRVMERLDENHIRIMIL